MSSSTVMDVGRLTLAPGASAATSRSASRTPAPGVRSSCARKIPTRKAGAGTIPRLRTVVGADTSLPASVPDGVVTVATTRSGRKSRIVSVAVSRTPSSAPTLSDSARSSARLPERLSALAVRIGTLSVLTISPGAKVRSVLAAV